MVTHPRSLRPAVDGEPREIKMQWGVGITTYLPSAKIKIVT